MRLVCSCFGTGREIVFFLAIVTWCCVPVDTDCLLNDYSCYEATLVASTIQARTLVKVYTDLDAYQQECGYYRSIKQCVDTDGEHASCNGEYSEVSRQPDLDAMAAFWELCSDDAEYWMSRTCISDLLIRTHSHICMDYALEYSTDDSDVYCSELKSGLKCAWYLLGDRCGAGVNAFADRMRIAALTSVRNTHHCDIHTGEYGSSQVMYIALGMMGIAYVFIPLFIRLTWCPPNKTSQQEIQVMDKMLTNWQRPNVT